MRRITENEIIEAVVSIVKEANFYLNEEMMTAFKKACKQEKSSAGKETFKQLINNAEIAAKEKIPMCQDTGVAVIFIEIGNKVVIEGDLYKAVNEGVRRGYKDGYLRKSIVKDPIFERKNTDDNTPAVIHSKIVKGERLKIIAAPKGGGSENMSRIKMMKPSDGVNGVKQFVINTVKKAGANPCPPIIVGVGIGGDFEKAALMSKEALLRPVDDKHQDLRTAKLEKELLEDINKLGIGPQGLGGRITALAVKIKTYPCHIASLPVAVNINCHAARHKEVVL